MPAVILSLLALLALINIPQVAGFLGFAILLGAVAYLVKLITRIVRNY
jgi:hypothetical protein